MALKKCKECGEKVSTRAKTCPSCGVTSPTTTGSESCAGCLILVIAVGGLAWWFGSGDGQQGEQAEPQQPVSETASDVSKEPTLGNETDARVMAWQFTEDALSPLVVDHDWGTECVYNSATKNWVARGSLTTNNGQIRRKYKCTLKWLQGTRWELVELLWLE